MRMAWIPCLNVVIDWSDGGGIGAIDHSLTTEFMSLRNLSVAEYKIASKHMVNYPEMFRFGESFLADSALQLSRSTKC